METKFTKGPLAVVQNTAGAWEVEFDCGPNRGDEYVCFSPASSSHMDEDVCEGDTAKANAHLISCAPEMYEILANIERWQKSNGRELEEYLGNSDAHISMLLAKARGEQQ